MTVSVDGVLSGRYPSGSGYQSMTDKDVWGVNQTYAFTQSCTVTFWDSDGGGDDSLGSFTVETSGTSSSSPVTLTGSGGNYTCTFSTMSCTA